MRFRLMPLLFLALLILVGGCNRCKDTCINGVCIKRSCSCDLWYEGDICDRSILTKFEAKYFGQARMDGLVEDVSFELKVTHVPDMMELEGLQLVIVFSNQTRFTISEQTWRNNLYTGEGEMLVDGISIRLDQVDQAQNSQVRIEANRAD